MQEIINKKTIDYITEIYDMEELRKNPTCYFYDLKKIKENIDLLGKYAPRQIQLFYAMKANTNERIMNYIAYQKFITGVEIASSGELKKALNYYATNQIIFTGPGKTDKELEDSIRTGIRLINVESIVEAIRINKIAEKLNIDKIEILLRININYSIMDASENMSGVSTKMGIDENQSYMAFKKIGSLSHIDIKGIHVFAASGVLNYKSLIKSVIYIFDFVKKLEQTGNSIEIIDFGGGLGIDYTDNNEQFDIKNYFIELDKLISLYYFENKQIIMELGTYLVGNAGYYSAKIIDIKEIKGHKHIIIAGGVNHMGLPLEMRRKHPIYIIPKNEPKFYQEQPTVQKELADVSGPLCMVTDKLSWNDYIEEANIGDIVVFRQAGAYCYGEGMMDFLSHPRPFELFIPDDNN